MKYYHHKYDPNHESNKCPEIYGKNIETYKMFLYSNLYMQHEIFASNVITLHAVGGFSDSVCSFVDRDVRNISLVKEFSIAHLTFSGHLQVEVNDHLAYIGPKVGKYLALVYSKNGYENRETTQVNGEEFMPCRNDYKWIVETKINLKSFLYEGNNTISLRSIESVRDPFIVIVINSAEYRPQALVGEESNSLFVDTINC